MKKIFLCLFKFILRRQKYSSLSGVRPLGWQRFRFYKSNTEACGTEFNAMSLVFEDRVTILVLIMTSGHSEKLVQ